MFIKAIEAAQEEIPAAEISAETPNVKLRPEPSARKADALAIIAESFLAQGPASLKGGDRHQIVLHVDVETLRYSAAGRCNFEHGRAFPRKRPGACLVIAASFLSSRTKTANLSTSAARRAVSLPRSTVR